MGTLTAWRSRLLGMGMLLTLLLVQGAIATTADAVQLAGHVAGIQGAQREPLPGALVQVLEKTSGVEVAGATTAFDGSYAVDVPADRYDIKVTPAAGSVYAPTTIYDHAVLTDAVLDVVVVLTGTVRFSGVVRDGLGLPAARVVVGLKGPAEGASRQLGVVTGPDGAFEFALAPGTYQFSLGGNWKDPGRSLSWYLPGQAPVVIDADRAVELRLPSMFDVDVRLADPEGNPVTGAAVSAQAPLADFDSGDIALRPETMVADGMAGADGLAHLRMFKTDGATGNGLAIPPAGSDLQPVRFDIPAINSNTTIVLILQSALPADSIPPTVVCDRAEDVWQPVNVSVACVASDLGVGLAEPADASFVLSTSVASGAEDATAQTASQQICDAASNCTIAGPFSAKVDRKPPDSVLVCAVDPLVGSAATASWGDVDGGSGLAGNATGTMVLDTSTVGGHTAQHVAVDAVGNSASSSCSYRVVFDFRGFFAPTDNVPALNSVKAGNKVNLKFSLGGDRGLAILASGSPFSRPIDCTSKAVIGVAEPVSRRSTLAYDPAASQYFYKWETDARWLSGSCRELVLGLADGTSHSAYFLLR